MARDVALHARTARPVTDDDQSALGHALLHVLVAAEQLAQPFTRLQPPYEQHVHAVVPQVSDRGQAGLENVDVDAVRNDAHGGLREVMRHEFAGRLADRDQGMQPLQVVFQDRAAVVVADVRARECMEGAHVGDRREPEHGDRQGRHQRLVKVEYVEPLPLQDLRHPVGKMEAESDPGH